MDGDEAGSPGPADQGGEDAGGGSGAGATASQKQYLAAGLVVLLVAAAGFVYLGGPQALPGGGQQQQDDGTDAFEQYADANQQTGTTETEGATVGATVEIQQYGTSPARVEIDTGQVVKWVNTNDFPVTLWFDRTSQTPTIDPGETLKMRFRGITEYRINNTATGEVHSTGQIYVG